MADKPEFTVVPLSGLCNVLKSFVTALSIGRTNILPRFDLHFPTNYSEIIDDSLICHGPYEFGEEFVSARLLILAREHDEQPDLINDAKSLGDHPNIRNKKLSPLFSTKSIDWFFDRSLICDSVFNRIVSGIEKIQWKSEVLSEVERISSQFTHPTLAVQIRTWTHPYDPPNTTAIRDGVIRNYNFETYRSAIDQFLPECKSIFLTSDNDAVIPQYLEYLKSHNVIVYHQPQNITYLQYAASTMLIASKCDMLVGCRLSTFSECIWWFSKCKQKVIAVF